MGGLGNQLFQISTVYALAKDVNDYFGIDFYKGDFTQTPAYNYYDIMYKKIKKIDLNLINFSFSYSESNFNYSEIPQKKNQIIKGYFQSEKYFQKYYNDLYNLYVDISIIEKLKKEFSFVNSLSLHVRRGDYLTKPNFHPTSSLSYYLDGIKQIELKYDIDKIYIFSDDINWCKNNFTDERCVFVEDKQDYEELYLMSLCEHNIIANSSFSWWGSYLNLNLNKIVIAPKIWFGTLFKGSWQDIYYKNNIII
jgi:hypothetical protein